MFKNLLKFIEKIRNSHEEIRRRWLVILSGSSMVIVIALWVLYINVTIQNTPSPVTETVKETQNPGLAEVFLTGFKIVTAQIKDSATQIINSLRKQVLTPNSITIDSLERNFVIENLEPIPKTPLP